MYARCISSYPVDIANHLKLKFGSKAGQLDGLAAAILLHKIEWYLQFIVQACWNESIVYIQHINRLKYRVLYSKHCRTAEQWGYISTKFYLILLAFPFALLFRQFYIECTCKSFEMQPTSKFELLLNNFSSERDSLIANICDSLKKSEGVKERGFCRS